MTLFSCPSLQNCFCADLVIEIADVNKQQDGAYRLFYDPPYGYPPPNTTISSREIGDSIQFSKGLPGTNYNFWLYYTNQTHRDWLTWRVSITTGKYRKNHLLTFKFPSMTHQLYFYSQHLTHHQTCRCRWKAVKSPSSHGVRRRKAIFLRLSWKSWDYQTISMSIKRCWSTMTRFNIRWKIWLQALHIKYKHTPSLMERNRLRTRAETSQQVSNWGNFHFLVG